MILIDEINCMINFNGEKIIFPRKFEKIFILDDIILVFLYSFLDWNDYFFLEKVNGVDLKDKNIKKYIDLEVVQITKEKFEEYKNSSLNIEAFHKHGRLWETGGYQDDKKYDRILYYNNDNLIWEIKDVQKWHDLASRNIIAFDYNGKQLWQIKTAKEILGGSMDGSYTAMFLDKGNLWVSNWIGFNFRIDIKTGEVLEKVFTK